MSRAIFLNKAKVINKLTKQALRAKAKDKDIKQIILFGSLARESFTGTSDADILIILKESKERFIDRIPRYLYLFLEAPIPVDVFPYTEKEVENIPLAQKALITGLVLA